MEIRIDTKKDSPEDIRKTIEFLKRLVETSTEGGEFNTMGDVSSGMAGLFGDTPMAGSSFDDEEDDDEDKDEEEKEKIEIIPY